jgi:hypothetical protein
MHMLLPPIHPSLQAKESKLRYEPVAAAGAGPERLALHSACPPATWTTWPVIQRA